MILEGYYSVKGEKSIVLVGLNALNLMQNHMVD